MRKAPISGDLSKRAYLLLFAVFLVSALEAADPPCNLPFPLSASPRLCGEAVIAIQSSDPPEPRTFHLAHGSLHAFAASPDGRLVASAQNLERYRITVHSVAQIRALWGLTVGSPVHSLAFSPSGRLLAVGLGSGEIILYDALSGRRLRSFIAREMAVSPLIWSPDSAWIASGSAAGIVIWHVLDIQYVYGFDHPTGRYTGLTFSPDGLVLVAANDAGEIRQWRADPVQRMTDFGTFPESVGAAAWSPTGDLVATGMESGRIILWDAATSEPLRYVDAHARAITTMSWSDDGMLLASGSRDGRVSVRDVRPGALFVSTLGYFDSPVMSVSIVPGLDGSLRIIGAATDGTITIWPFEE